MTVIVNDYRGRNPQHEIDAMIHHPNCSQAIRYGHAPYWRSYTSLESAESAIGALAYTCQV